MGEDDRPLFRLGRGLGGRCATAAAAAAAAAAVAGAGAGAATAAPAAAAAPAVALHMSGEHLCNRLDGLWS